MRTMSRFKDEAGVALITALLAVMLISGLMAGMFASLTADQRSHAVDRDQSQAYAAAHAGLEKLTASLGQLFETDFSPSAAQIDVVDNTPPVIAGFQFTSPGGAAGSGYNVSFNPDGSGNPAATPNADITTGPFTGLKGLITPYTLTVTARSTGGSEVRLRRELQTVAVPVFQFGIFGEKSLSFHAGAAFDFGGRVHTNEHLFLAAQNGTLTFRDKLTAIGQVVRHQLENTNPIATSGHVAAVSIPTVIGSSYRNLAANEGSVLNGPLSAPVGGWKNLSEVTYNTNIRNTLTGAKRLDLPLVSQGAEPIDLIRRPALGNEHVANKVVFLQRYYAQASLRILLSDRASDLTGLPTIDTTVAPIELTSAGLAAAGYTVDVASGRTPVASSIGPMATAPTIAATGGDGAAGTGTITVNGGVPNWLRMGGVASLPLGSITFGAINVHSCTGMTATTLTGCTTTGNPPTNTPAVAPVGLVGGGEVSLRTSGVATSGANPTRTVPVVTTRNLTLGTRLVWAGNTPITCSGYTGAQLTLCSWPAVPANNTPLSTHALSDAGQSLLGGFIKIERQNNAGAWTDVTRDILDLGFAAPNQEGGLCADPSPNAVIRLQRLRDSGTTAACGYGATGFPTDFWPNALYDAREGTPRDLATDAAMSMGGVINFVTLDVGNLKRWLSGAIGATGTTAWNNNGYIVYFSDRRGNHNPLTGFETGEYGYEDSINVAAGANAWAPNTILEAGEDRNENGTLQTYGGTVSVVAGVVPGGATLPFATGATPMTTVNVNRRPEARVNRQVLFRRALKLANGCIGNGTNPLGGCNAANNVNNLPDAGLTVTSENAVYVHGSYNAKPDAIAENAASRPAAIIADVLTILSRQWTDVSSLNSPNNRAGRVAETTGYRFALIAGKSIAFPKPGAWGAQDFGTDGGVHNFMRMLEDWGGKTIHYRGSIVSLYTARQFTGIYRVNENIYNPGTRTFAFDTNFLTPALLPPGTPMFRDVNTLKFRQILRPNQ